MCWRAPYALLMLAATSIDYSLGCLIDATHDVSKRKKFLILSLFSNFGILLIFKYLGFFNELLRSFFALIDYRYPVSTINILLPMGISFHIFQTQGYTIEVYRKEIKAEKNFFMYALYVAYFPQLVAGPIERAGKLIPELYQKNVFSQNRIVSGVRLMMIGFFKKVVIADRLSVFVDNVYHEPQHATGLSLLMATYFFAIQIYCDFSGYTDVARGSSRVIGIELMENFNRPYSATSIADFWRRWHISLSSWFKDYLYFPLGGSRGSWWMWARNTMIVFLASGLWHGANMTFVVWGAIHGFYLIAGRLGSSYFSRFFEILHIVKYPKIYRRIQQLLTFHWVLIAWVFFRANHVQDAIYILKHSFLNWKFDLNYLGTSLQPFAKDRTAVANALFVFLLLCINYYSPSLIAFSKKKISYRLLADVCLLLMIFIFGRLGTQNFIYFQF